MRLAKSLEKATGGQVEAARLERCNFRHRHALESQGYSAGEADGVVLFAQLASGTRHEAGWASSASGAQLEDILRLEMAAALIDGAGTR
ncbi:hypothetical protein D3C77_563110 [compost metagenome]